MLDGNACGTAIFQALDSADLIADDAGDAEQIMQIICTQIFEHIEENDPHTHTDSEGGTTTPPNY